MRPSQIKCNKVICKVEIIRVLSLDIIWDCLRKIWFKCMRTGCKRHQTKEGRADPVAEKMCGGAPVEVSRDSSKTSETLRLESKGSGDKMVRTVLTSFQRNTLVYIS